MSLFSGPTQRWITADDVFRPINYLGAKSRSLSTLLSVVTERHPRRGVAADLFAGTTVVAQGLARTGFEVLAADVSELSSVFGRALLGIAKPSSIPSASELLAVLAGVDFQEHAREVYSEWSEREDDAVARGDGQELIEILREVPQAWRAEHASPRQKRLFEQLSSVEGRDAIDVGALTVSYYGGTYFGIGQALDIDRIRVQIERARRTNQLGAWECAVLLTALLSAASEIVYSPGKHFAQYHSVRASKDLTFQRQRMLRDRSLDVERIFRDRTRAVLCYGGNINGDHRALSVPFEAFLEDPRPLADCNLIYADPPYTAQQYSRFYHVPEQITRYEVPILQRHKGKTTKGIYPTGKYKSRFCSKRQAPRAFRDLVELADRVSADLAISYAEVASGKTGNARMIDLDSLLDILEGSSQATVEVFALDHNYRQFNSMAAARSDRVDRELLLYRSAR